MGNIDNSKIAKQIWQFAKNDYKVMAFCVKYNNITRLHKELGYQLKHPYDKWLDDLLDKEKPQ